MISKDKMRHIGVAVCIMLGGFIGACGDARQSISPLESTAQSGDISFAIPLGKIAARTLVRAEVVITAPDISRILQELEISGNTITGTVQGIPAGDSRIFTLNGYDETGSLIYSGSTEVFLPIGDTVPVQIAMRSTNGRLWFIHFFRGLNEIWSTLSDGTDARLITEALSNSRFQSIDISPDGSQIAFSLNDISASNPYKVKIRNLHKGQTSTIYESQSPIRSVRWSEDGKQILCSVGQRMVIIDIDAQQFAEFRLTLPPTANAYDAENYNAVWAKEGPLIYTTVADSSGLRDGYGSIYSVNIDSIKVSSLTIVSRDMLTKISNSNDCGPVSISPDGTMLAYARLDKGVFVSQSDGRFETKIASGDHYGVTWSPDGQEIVFFSPYGSGLSRVSADGSSSQQSIDQLVRFSLSSLVWTRF